MKTSSVLRLVTPTKRTGPWISLPWVCLELCDFEHRTRSLSSFPSCEVRVGSGDVLSDIHSRVTSFQFPSPITHSCLLQPGICFMAPSARPQAPVSPIRVSPETVFPPRLGWETHLACMRPGHRLKKQNTCCLGIDSLVYFPSTDFLWFPYQLLPFRAAEMDSPWFQ